MLRNLDVLEDGVFDLLVIGGGITGAGIALDAGTRGLRVALVDKGDFASGTSSVSSKLVHGGLRYLEHGYLHLVYEALHERSRLLRNAPHLVRPLRFIIPFYAGSRMPGWKWRVGLTMYDVLAGAGNLHRSRPIPLKALRREFPTLEPRGLQGAGEYYDAQMDDARLCLEVLKTAASRGACPANYVEVVGFERSNGKITGVEACDRQAGERQLTIRARQIVNAAGPWVDKVCGLAGDDGSPRLRPTKGVHIVVANPGLDAAFLLLHPEDGRVFFVIPWFRTHLLIGTTDTLVDEGPDKLSVKDTEIAYLLAGYNRFFGPELLDGDVQGSFAGLRPLIRSGPDDPSAMSREHRLFESPGGLLSAAGGKYTTFRKMAEQITDEIVSRLGRRRRCRTRALPLDGAPQGDWQAFAARTQAGLQAGFDLDEATALHLVDRYGRRASEVAGYLEREPDARERIVDSEPDLKAELAYQREQEMALSAEDHLLRRTRLGLMHPRLLAKE